MKALVSDVRMGGGHLGGTLEGENHSQKIGIQKGTRGSKHQTGKRGPATRLYSVTREINDPDGGVLTRERGENNKRERSEKARERNDYKWTSPKKKNL